MPATVPGHPTTGHWIVEVQLPLVRCTRTEKGFATAEQIAQGYGEMVEALRDIDRAHARLLVDLRRAVGRNDPTFEEVAAPYRRAQLEGFSSVALLVKSTVGQMQVQRHMREDGFDVGVFLEEAEALAYLGS